MQFSSWKQRGEPASWDQPALPGPPESAPWTTSGPQNTVWEPLLWYVLQKNLPIILESEHVEIHTSGAVKAFMIHETAKPSEAFSYVQLKE